MKYLTAISILLLSHGLYAGGHDDSEPSFEGLISSEIFDFIGLCLGPDIEQNSAILKISSGCVSSWFFLFFY